MAEKPREDSDQEIIDRIVRGDDEGFARLIDKHHTRVFRLVRGIVGDWHQSEDVCQEIYTLVFRKLGGFRRQAAFSTWLYRVSVNAALKARRRRRRRETEPATDLCDMPSPEDPRPVRLEGDEVLEKLLSPLPRKLRVPVVLREQVGLSYAEIAEVLGASRGAVEQRLHRAMVLLREVWKNTEGIASRGWLET